MRRVLLAVLAAGCAARAQPGPRPSLVTTAEQSGFVRTGRHAEAVQLCEDFGRAYPDRARCERFGVSLEGRALVALIVSADGTLTPEAAAARRRPVILVEGGIHAGEIEGKDAGFLFARDLLDGKVAPGALAAVTFVFVPILNVDGHERFGPNQRPNQRGPEEGGFRTTAANLNANRDWMKVDTEVVAALLGLWRRWDPVLFADLHATDGAKFEHDIAVMLSPRARRDEPLGQAAAALSDALQARLTALGHLPLPFYPSFDQEDDPMSGVTDGEAPPRFSTGYTGARDRIGILVETHSWRTYPERVRSTYDFLQALFERAVRDAAAWRAAADTADATSAALGGREVTLAWKATDVARTFAFRGYAYERVPSEVSGGTWTRYDETRPAVWNLPLRDQIVPAITVRAPRGGYLVPAGFAAAVAARLDAHALRYQRLVAPLTVDGEVFRATKVEHTPPFEGRARVTVTGAWTAEPVEVGPGALWIPIAQPRARLLLHLLEPTLPDSLCAWGFFSAAFEQKEYMEPYVAEEEARRMLADPVVKAAFEAALADPELAKSPEQRLDFFYRRHPSWDRRKDVVPVYRVETDPFAPR